VRSPLGHSRDEALKESLAGAVAVVTGGAQGIGLAVVAELAAQGAVVTAVDIQGEKVAAVADELRAQGALVKGIQLDVADSQAIEATFTEIATAAGRLDILVNSAGIAQWPAAAVELDLDTWEQVLDVNLTGTFRCCRAAARLMQGVGRGSIVNISSINGQTPAPLVAAYNASKAAVLSLTKTLAIELAANGIRVNAVCPGPIHTELNRPIVAARAEALGISEEEMVERIRQAIPLGRWGEPNDVAAAVAFLCSSDASWITGEILTVSGGLDAVPAARPGTTEKPVSVRLQNSRAGG
jgi:NAD(P)-dependent dehydrogenase (short-subunit alcohol dehydrogenase family)